MRTPWLPRLKLRQRQRLVPGAASKNQRRLGWRGSPSLFGDQVAATVACPQLTNDHSSLVNRVLLLNTHRVATLLRAEKEGGKNYSHFLTTKCTFGYLLQYSETCLVLARFTDWSGLGNLISVALSHLHNTASPNICWDDDNCANLRAAIADKAWYYLLSPLPLSSFVFNIKQSFPNGTLAVHCKGAVSVSCTGN